LDNRRAFRLGVGPDLAPRLPVALMAWASWCFIGGFSAGNSATRAAWFATLILGCCGGWLVYSQVGVPDMPVAAAFSAAMLLALGGSAGATRGIYRLPRLCSGWRCWPKGGRAGPGRAPMPALPQRARFGPAAGGGALPRGALPWYLLCYLRNGKVFLHDFFVVHNFERSLRMP